MATWADLKELRLKICDPQNVIDLVSVANISARPTAPAAQTAYLVQDLGVYQIYDAGLADWIRVDLELSDSRLGALIDAFGMDRAAAEAIDLIIVSIGKKLWIARSQSGSEGIDFVNLTTAYNFYKSLSEAFREKAKEADGVSTGLYCKTRHVHVAGGMRG